jgi:hypothetical protein
VPLVLTVLLAGARVLATPALTDPVSGPVPSTVHLKIPWLYLAFAPLFTLWDGASMLSMSRLQGLLAGLALLYLLWRAIPLVRRSRNASWLREGRTLVTSVALFAVFLVGGAMWHRPMLALAGVGPDELVVDFHSHTNASHDVRGTWMSGFDAEANRRWHARAGFDAEFITDHNTVAGRAAAVSGGRPVVCPGIEVSAWRSHIVLLGDSLPVDRSRYNHSADGLLLLLRTSESAYGSLSVASLPEYRRNFWDRLDTLVVAGLDGLEIVNAAPKANELSRAERDTVIGFARQQNRFVVGVSDSHGWGATSMVWNLVPVPRAQQSRGVCGAILGRLRLGFPAARVVERHRVRPDSWWPIWLTPVGVVWETWRAMGWSLTAAWLGWIWGWAAWRRRRAQAPSVP